MMFKVIYDGQEYEGEPEDFDEFEPGFRAKVARDGIFLDSSGTRFQGAELNRVRARFSGAGERLAELAASRQEEWDEGYSPLIPGLWNKGTQPLLIGQKGAGKSRLGLDLLETLITPGRRMFGTFEPALLGPDEWVVYVNAENPPGMVEAEIERRGMNEVGLRPFRVEHLPRMGGPSVFDPMDRQSFMAWAAYLSECNVCTNRNLDPPSVAIVDGLTALLGGPSLRYGEWIAAFRELMAYIDMPTALVIAHSTYDGTHPLGGTEGGAGSDGLWFLTMSKGGRRAFRTEPRFDPSLEVKSVRVEMTEDGRLRAGHTIAVPPNPDRSASEQAPPVPDRILDFVEHENRRGVEPLQGDIRQEVRGDAAKINAAIRTLVEEGRLEFSVRRGRGNPAKLYRVAGRGQDADAKDAK